MWQFVKFEELLALEDVQTVVLAQQDFATPTPKPTRFLLPLRPAKVPGRPQFDEDGWYIGPLPKRSGSASLMQMDRAGNSHLLSSRVEWGDENFGTDGIDKEGEVKAGAQEKEGSA